jgi:SAM-dependent methyltransferase
MNDGLWKYQEDEQVISIHGYIYPLEQTLPETFFLKGADCWGWATWKRGWDLFESDGQSLLDELKRQKLTRLFDLDGSYPYTKMLQDQILGRNNSWAIRWYASAFLKDKLTLYPGRSLVHNIGLDGSGIHCSVTSDFSSKLANYPISIEKILVDESISVKQAIINFHKRTRPLLPVRIIRKVWARVVRVTKQYILKQQYAPNFLGLWLNPFYHSRSGLRKAIGQMARHLNGRLLDVGCGRKPYRELFLTNEYVGLEIDTPENRANKQADFFYNGNSFPFADQDFNGAVCNQVLEHVFTPDLFLGEIHRVLKPGGLLLLTIPFVWDEHEQPWDYARYSSFGLKSLLSKNGFEVLEQQKINADVRVLFQLVNAYLFKVLWTRWSVVNLLICATIMAPFNILGVLLYKVLPDNPDLYLDQVVLARKIANE